MGNVKSKSRSKETRGYKQSQDQAVPDMQETNASGNFSTEMGAAYDPELVRMRKELQKDQQAFLLNNLMLCVQFFENYDQEILDIRAAPVSRQEHDLNTIISQSQKHVLLPDVLQEQVARHVKFTSTRQTVRPTIEPLQPVRMYIVLDNVDVSEVPEVSEYSNMSDATFYNMCLEPGSNQGYVKLRSLEVTPPLKSPTTEGSESDLSSIAEDEDELYSEGDNMFDARMNPGEKFLSQVEKRANALPRSPFVRSTSDLRTDSRLGPGSKFTASKSKSQTDLFSRHRSELESEPSERRLSGLTKPQSNQVLRAQIGSHSKLRQLKAQRHSSSTESSPASSGSSGYRSGTNYMIDSDSDYGYATITNFNTPKPLVRPANIPVSSSEIPTSCFTKIAYTKEGKIYNEKAEKIQLKNTKQRRIKMALQKQIQERVYLKSDEFMHYFEDLFASRLAEPLGFTDEDVNEATTQASIIYCDTMQILERNRMLIVPHEITPSVPTGWPGSAGDWLERGRREVLDPSSNLIYTWPTKKMIAKIKKFGCHIVPEGYIPKRQANPQHTVEWQVTFPAAERYLEMCLSHAQIRVYLMMLMLHKTFIRPVDTTFGLTTSHIRTQLFWLLEQNYAPPMWPETRAGESLRRLLRKLYSGVSQSPPYLPDYFISSKNVFANIPRQYLLLTQKQLNRIINNPVMYMIGAMENIRYKPEFFPIINYKRLLKILTISNSDLVSLINPALGRVDKPMQIHVQDEEMFEERIDHIGAFWVKIKGKEDATKALGHKNVINKSENSFQDLIVEISMQCGELRGLRLAAVLEMFINHFIKMAERCYHYGAMTQKNLYLNQSERLSVLLSEHPTGKEDAHKYLETVRNLRIELERIPTMDEAPLTPERNDQPSLSVPLNQHFTNDQPASIFLPINGENQEYEIHYSPQRRPTVNFRNTTMEMEHDGSVTLGNVNDVEMRNMTRSTKKKVVSLADGTDGLDESTYI